MINFWLGRNWDEVKSELEGVGKPYAFHFTRPHGKMVAWGPCRVVRVREFEDRVELILAHERFSLSQT